VWLLLIVGWLLPNLVMVISYISIIRANRSHLIFSYYWISLLNSHSAFLNNNVHCFYTFPFTIISMEFFESHNQRKFIDGKKTKLFRFLWNWAEEKKLRGIRLQISSFSPYEGVVIL
jgi:hypothetical protein